MKNPFVEEAEKKDQQVALVAPLHSIDCVKAGERLGGGYSFRLASD